MNKVTLALATSTAGLAFLCGYLWQQLDVERQRSQFAARQQTELQARLTQLERDQRPALARDTTKTVVPAPGAAQVPVVSAARPVVPDDSDVDQMALHNARQQKRWQDARRRMLQDPRERELLRAQARSEARAANMDLAHELQLTDKEYDRLIELLAEHQLQMADAFNRGDGNISSDVSYDFNALRERLAQEVEALLGYERAQQYATFEDSRQVRTQVRRLRGRLSEGDALTDEQNQRLVAALQKQRLSFNEAMQRRVPKERVSASRSTWDGGNFVADRTSTLPVQEQFMKQIEEFRKLQRQSAAEVLTARQLRAFVQMQEQMLADERLDARMMTIAGEAN
jgi:hypothetical protein